MSVRVTSNRDPKVCCGCGVSKPLSAYYEKRPRGRNKTTKLYTSRCRTCAVQKVSRYIAANVVKVATYRKLYYTRLKQEGRANLGWKDRHFSRLYNTTQSAYDLQLAAQNQRCAVCNLTQAETGTRFPYDHDHATGQTRGVLCSRCNGGLGCFSDNVELLKAAIRYLQDWAVLHLPQETGSE